MVRAQTFCNHIQIKKPLILIFLSYFHDSFQIKARKKVPTRAPTMPPRGPLPNPLGALWGPPKLGGPVTLSRVLPPVGGPEVAAASVLCWGGIKTDHLKEGFDY